MSLQEGTIPFAIPGVQERCYTWYKTVGDITKATPLIFLHGGPGAGHADHFHLATPLEAIGIPSIHYDQVGCARSSRIREKAEDEVFWGFDLFCAEIDNLVDFFKLRERGFYVHGQSWGGMLASIYAGRQPRGLRKLVIANSTSSAAIYAKEMERLFKALPVSDAVMKMDADQDYDNPEYVEACGRFAKKHFCTLDPWPVVLNSSNCDESTSMNRTGGKKGISRIRLPGFQGDYDSIKTAGNIEAPTLLLSGRYDWNTEAAVRPWFQTIPRVKWAVLEKSGHMAALEEPERYVELLKNFLHDSE